MALLVATGGVILMLQGRVNALWESGFYAAVSPLTQALQTTGSIMIVFGGAYAAATAAWWAGARWGGLTVLGASSFLAVGAPWPMGLTLMMLALIVMFDLMVMRLREARRDAAD